LYSSNAKTKHKVQVQIQRPKAKTKPNEGFLFRHLSGNQLWSSVGQLRQCCGELAVKWSLTNARRCAQPAFNTGYRAEAREVALVLFKHLRK
jgi:hypothetical protein